MKLNLLTFVGPALIGKGSRIAHHSGATNIVRWASPIPNDYSAPGEEPPPFTSNLQVSSLMYGFAEFRGIVRKYDKYFNEGRISKRQEKKLKKENGGIGLVSFKEPELIDTRNSAANPFPAAKMKNPVTAAAVLRFLELNEKYIGQTKKGKKVIPTFAGVKTRYDVPMVKQNLQELGAEFDADILEYDDQFSSPYMWSGSFKDTLVYSIVVNRKNKRITVVFRGSASKKDWAANLRFIKNTPDIIDEFTESKPKIHKGFAGYLLDKPIKEKEAKIDQIINVLKEVYSFKDESNGRDYSDYDLYVTGHSLGGALTQLCAFVLAGSEKSSFIPKPINAISFASPIVGNGDFAEEHQKLEKDGKLRHIRVSNQGDAVPAEMFWFKQTGINFHVKEGEEMEVAYLNGKSFGSQVNLGSGARHSLQGEGSYCSRLYAKDESGKYLNKEVLDKPIEKLYEDYAEL